MNKFEFDSKDNESSLSNMINEYDSDNALRNKIESIKKQKAMEEEKKQQRQWEETPRGDFREKREKPVHETAEIPPMGSSRPFVNADTEMTQVFHADRMSADGDGDKTLVIMDNKSQRNYGEYESTTMDAHSEEGCESDSDERLAPEFEINNEKITEEDIEEYLPEDNKKNPKKSKDADSANKAITYVIIGVISLCVIGLTIFGLNALGVFGGKDDSTSLNLDEVVVSEENKEEIGANHFSIKESEVEKITDARLISLAEAEARSTEEGTKVQITTVDKSDLKSEKGTYKVTFSTRKGTEVTVKATVTVSDKDDDEEDDKKDNSAKRTELEGQIKVYQDRIAALEAENAADKDYIDTSGEAKAKIANGYNERLMAAKREYGSAEAMFNTAKAELDNANASGDADSIAAAQEKYATAEAALNTAGNNLTALEAEISSKQNEIDAEVVNKQTATSQRNQEIINLQNEIKSLQDQLNNLD